MRAAKACSDPDCPNAQPCPIHRKEPWAGSTRRTRLPKDWEARRRIVLDRDPVCKDGRVCHHLAPSTQVDHVIPNNGDGIENLQGICSDCHAAKSSAEGNAAQGARI